MHIRRATPHDEASLGTIRRAAILTLTTPTLTQAEAAAWAAQLTPDRIARALRDHDVWVAVAGDIIGWVEVDGDRIAALYVDPTAAGRGIGSALLAHAEIAIQSAGYAKAQLEASRNALHFYGQRGYLPCGPPDAADAHPLHKMLPVAGNLPQSAL